MQCKGYLLYNRVVIPDEECANDIYWDGFYGTFLGVSKPKKKGVKAPLELSIIEALYLLEKQKLSVYKGNVVVNEKELYNYGLCRIQRFKELYLVYKDLRDKGFVVRRGLKFGCDYLVYRYGPGIDHAPYGVQVFKLGENVDPIELVRMGRLLHSVRKKLVLALVTGDNQIKYLLLEWWRP